MSLPLRWRGRSMKPIGCCVAGRSTMKRPMCAAQFATTTTLRTATITSGFGLGLRPLSSRTTESAGDAMRSKACPKAALPRFGGEARPVPGRASYPGRANTGAAPSPAAPTVGAGQPLPTCSPPTKKGAGEYRGLAVTATVSSERNDLNFSGSTIVLQRARRCRGCRAASWL